MVELHHTSPIVLNPFFSKACGSLYEELDGFVFGVHFEALVEIAQGLVKLFRIIVAETIPKHGRGGCGRGGVRGGHGSRVVDAGLGGLLVE